MVCLVYNCISQSKHPNPQGLALDAGEDEEEDMVERVAGTESRGKKRGGKKTGKPLKSILPIW